MNTYHCVGVAALHPGIELDRAAVELRSFTMPELAIAAAVSYETVKKVLKDAEGVWVERTGETSAASVGRPPRIWRVSDEGALRAHLRGDGSLRGVLMR